VVINDFIPRIVSNGVLATLKDSDHWDIGKLKLFLQKDLDNPFMPVEFSVAAYRLGHSMVPPAIGSMTPCLKQYSRCIETRG